MPKLKTKTHRYFVSLNSAQESTLRDLMGQDLFVRGEESNCIGSLLTEVKKCRAEHGRVRQGRPRKEAPNIFIPEDTLSFSDEEIAGLKK